MSAKSCADRPDLRFLAKAWITWLLSAGFFLLAFALIICYTSCSSRHVAYLCSLISFLASVVSGLTAARMSRFPAFLTALICAVSTLILLLLIGTLLDRRSLDPSSVLSLVSFTLTGYLAGSVFSERIRRKHRSSHSLRFGNRRRKS